MIDRTSVQLLEALAGRDALDGQKAQIVGCFCKLCVPDGMAGFCINKLIGAKGILRIEKGTRFPSIAFECDVIPEDYNHKPITFLNVFACEIALI